MEAVNNTLKYLELQIAFARMLETTLRYQLERAEEELSNLEHQRFTFVRDHPEQLSLFD